MNTKPGIIGKKLGMTQLFKDDGTVLRVHRHRERARSVVGKRTRRRTATPPSSSASASAKEKHAHEAAARRIQEGRTQTPKRMRPRAPLLGRVRRQVRGRREGRSSTDIFEAGPDRRRAGHHARSRLHRRHAPLELRRLVQTHGTHEYSRHGGSIGTNMTPGRTLPSLKMPGQYGNETVSVLNLKVAKIDRREEPPPHRGRRPRLAQRHRHRARRREEEERLASRRPKYRATPWPQGRRTLPAPRSPSRSEAKERGFPARSVFKLEEIDRRVRLFKKGQRVLDLGAAPGSWSLYAAERMGLAGKLLAVDLVAVGRGRRPERRTLSPGRRALARHDDLALFAPYDVVLSDMAPARPARREADQARSFELFMRALEIAGRLAPPGRRLRRQDLHGRAISPREKARERAFREPSARSDPKGRASSSFEIFVGGSRAAVESRVTGVWGLARAPSTRVTGPWTIVRERPSRAFDRLLEHLARPRRALLGSGLAIRNPAPGL